MIFLSLFRYKQRCAMWSCSQGLHAHRLLEPSILVYYIISNAHSHKGILFLRVISSAETGLSRLALTNLKISFSNLDCLHVISRRD